METKLLNDYIIEHLEKAFALASKIDENSPIDYLHDFRLAIRKSRCLLKLFFKDEKKLEKSLHKIVKKTNYLRELDIFVLTLSKQNHPTLFKSMANTRESYYKEICTKKFIKKSLKRLNFALKILSKLPCNYTNQDFIDISKKHYEKSKELFEKITSKDSSDELHKIRIHFKKSRYALEFLTKTKLSDESDSILQCKKAQEYFGLIQDVSNQIDWLEKFCKNNSAQECESLIKSRKKQLEEIKNLLN